MFDVSKIDCGNSRVDVSPVDVSKMDSMSWQNDEYKEGFINSHSGPCEAWIDDTMVFQNDDCRKNYPSYPAELPVDYSSCKGKCLFEFYWTALHEPNWQMYKNCVPIVNNNPMSSKPTSSTSSLPQVKYTTTIINGTCTCSMN